MPKRHLSVRIESDDAKRGFFGRMSWFGTSSRALPPVANRSSVTGAMQRRRRSVQAAVDDISMQFSGQTSMFDTPPSSPVRRTGLNPDALPPLHVVGPAKGKTHSATLILLHGFTCSGQQLASELMPSLKSRLMPSAYGSIKFVFLTAPKRRVSCYDDPNQEENAWHDYFTDHGGAEGRPDIEEEIDLGQLEWTRAQVHKVIDDEAALLGGDYKKIAVLGQSQGSCTSLHCVLTHPRSVAGILCSIGQLYSHTPVPKDRKDELQVL